MFSLITHCNDNTVSIWFSIRCMFGIVCLCIHIYDSLIVLEVLQRLFCKCDFDMEKTFSFSTCSFHRECLAECYML